MNKYNRQSQTYPNAKISIQETVHNLTGSCEKQIAKSFKQALAGNSDDNDRNGDRKEEKQGSTTGTMKYSIISQRQEKEKKSTKKKKEMY